jgi:hypothetical protein
MGLAHRLKISLHPAQVGHAALPSALTAAQAFFAAHAVLVGFRLSERFKNQSCCCCLRLEPGPAGFLNFCATSACFSSLIQVGIQLTQDVFHPCEVFARVGQAVFGFAAALFVFGNTRRLLRGTGAVLRAWTFDDAADGALADDGVGAWPQAGAQEHVLHVAAAHGLVVDVVAAGAVTRQHTLDRDLGKLAPLAAGAVVGVVKYQLHAGIGWRPCGWLVPLKITSCMDSPRNSDALAFAQHPAHGVHDVGLAATIWARPRRPAGPGSWKWVGSANDLNPESLMEETHGELGGRGGCPARALNWGATKQPACPKTGQTFDFIRYFYELRRPTQPTAQPAMITAPPHCPVPTHAPGHPDRCPAT